MAGAEVDRHRSARLPELGRRVLDLAARLGHNESTGRLGDFTTTGRVVPISILATGIGALSAFVAFGLLRLIGLFTNIFFFGRIDTALVSPAGNQLGAGEIAIPVAGGILIGLMARFGSERIRGHGIPEAIEAILINGSRVDPKLAILKPLSSAVSIGSGGPFGAEGPIIMTGGAFGSLIGQLFHLTGAERKTVLVAGAAGGMSATFASPVAAVLLAVELLLFEWKPRSVIPVALASTTAAGVRAHLLGTGPLFPVPDHAAFIGIHGLAACALVGLFAGAGSGMLTFAVYSSEDAFHRLPIHWMWWPAIGGLVVGAGGLLFPQALGVGYDTIGSLLQGSVTGTVVLGVLIVKSVIWAISLGSGTSGGVLAPLLMIGGALGALESTFLPGEGPGFWPLVSMCAMLGGTMRSPFTAVVFGLELTHDVNAMLPLLVAVVVAHGFTVLVLRRSILTEKVSRRGYHIARDYSTDPLETHVVREVMRTNPLTFAVGQTVEQAAQHLDNIPDARKQRLFPVVDYRGRLIGVVTDSELTDAANETADRGRSVNVGAIAHVRAVIAYSDETLRAVAFRMAASGRTRLPVTDRLSSQLLGLISVSDLLKARAVHWHEESRRERVLAAIPVLRWSLRAKGREIGADQLA